jgi:hypothetical protein
MEFKEFPKIQQLLKTRLQITQKLNGTNAQVVIFDTPGGIDIKCGSRNRWITPDDDNFGFARFVYENKADFIEKLGIGTHFGEWCGPGIQSSEGLSVRTFVLFEHWKYPSDRLLPVNTIPVPVLYIGTYEDNVIAETISKFKIEGSKLVPGFMRVEGVVVNLGGHNYKYVFDAEETAWTKKTRVQKEPLPELKDFGYLMQPIRLGKILSKDERLLVGFPKSIVQIADIYIHDLVTESQVTKEDLDFHKKDLRRQVCSFIKEVALSLVNQ